MTDYPSDQFTPENREVGLALWELLDLLIDYDCACVRNAAGHQSYDSDSPQIIEVSFSTPIRSSDSLPPDFYPYTVQVKVDSSKKFTEHSAILQISDGLDVKDAIWVTEMAYAINMQQLTKLLPQLQNDKRTSDLMIAMLQKVGCEEYDVKKYEEDA